MYLSSNVNLAKKADMVESGDSLDLYSDSADPFKRAIEAILALSLKTVSINEVMEFFEIEEEFAIEISEIANCIISGIEEGLILLHRRDTT